MHVPKTEEAYIRNFRKFTFPCLRNPISMRAKINIFVNFNQKYLI